MGCFRALLRMKLVRFRLLPFVQDIFFLFFMTFGRVNENSNQKLVATAPYIPGRPMLRHKEARNLLYRLSGCTYMWLYVPGRKTSSDVYICLLGTVAHYADDTLVARMLGSG